MGSTRPAGPGPSDRVRHVDRDGLRLDVLDEGPFDGDPVVLLHGFPQRATSWAKVAPLLHEAGLRTLAPDQRGYSPAARPTSRSAYVMDELVGDLAALVAAVGRPVHLVGHDWGAAVGWTTAAVRPELLRTLTAVSVPPAAAMLSGSQPLRSWYMLAFQLPRLPERLLAGRVGRRALRASGMDEDLLARFGAEVVDAGALPGALGWYRALPLTRRGLLRGRVTLPTTFVWSDADTAIGRAAASRAGHHVDGPYSFVELPGVSHWIPDEAPHALAAAILDRCRPAK